MTAQDLAELVAVHLQPRGASGVLNEDTARAIRQLQVKSVDPGSNLREQARINASVGLQVALVTLINSDARLPDVPAPGESSTPGPYPPHRQNSGTARPTEPRDPTVRTRRVTELGASRPTRRPAVQGT